MFIVAAVQHIKIGDLSIHQSGDGPSEQMDADDDYNQLPEGTEMGDSVVLSRDDERALVIDSTASFAGKHSLTVRVTSGALSPKYFRLGDLPLPASFCIV